MADDRDSDVDALLGFREDEEERVGWFWRLFASCTPKPPINVRKAMKTVNLAQLSLDTRRSKLVEEKDEAIATARRAQEQHNANKCKTPFVECSCNAASTGRIHLRKATRLSDSIKSIEQQFLILDQQQNTLDSVKTINAVKNGMAAANTALSGELGKHKNGKEIEEIQDQMSENQEKWKTLNQSLGTSFNYVTGDTTDTLEISEDVWNEMQELLEEPQKEEEPTRKPRSQLGRVSSRRIPREHEMEPTK